MAVLELRNAREKNGSWTLHTLLEVIWVGSNLVMRVGTRLKSTLTAKVAKYERPDLSQQILFIE